LRVLAIETSGRVGSIALLESENNGEPVRALLERQTPADQQTARSLLPTIETALAEHGWRPKELELICVTTGPGSFTGLRIGVVTAKTLAYATGARLVGVHTLTAIAAGVEDHRPGLWTLLDAQRQELFVASFSGLPLVDQAVPMTEILSLPAWIQRLKPGDVVAGPPLAKCRELLPAGVVVADESFWEPKASAAGALGFELLKRGGDVSPLELVPHYYRKSAAEEKAAKKPKTAHGR